MSDFLISLNKKYNGKDLLQLIKKPYGKYPSDGCCFDFPWGSVAVLRERIARNKNIIFNGTQLLAWAGDLIMNSQDMFPESLINRLNLLQKRRDNNNLNLKTDRLFEKISGSFAIISANDSGFCIVTDPLSFIPVYAGMDEHNELVSFGTHPDLVAATSIKSFSPDTVSAAEFLNSGNCSFPNTMYINVKEMEPGRAYIIKTTENNKVNVKDLIYWSPPKEIRDAYDENELAEELRNTLISAVTARCDSEKVAVLLSGGLDSRMIMSAVPKSVNCIGLTFCEELNRETKIANKVARCYNRKWFPLLRDNEFLGRNIINAVKLSGCESDWIDAHAMGFADEIQKYGVDVLLSGTHFDTYLKSCLANDMVRLKRMGGALPPRYEKRSFDYADNLKSFWKQHLRRKIIEDVYSRRKNYYEKNIDPNRNSMECLNIYPFSQTRASSSWLTDRRVLPIRLVMADRHLLDFAFRCPVELKKGGKIFDMAAKNIYGNGSKIPNANDGVKPCSGHTLRLAQRSIRKVNDKVTQIFIKLGKEHRVQHSWHDYQTYWQKSKVLNRLIQEYGKNLNGLGENLFTDNIQPLLNNQDIHWENGLRLLQLALWQNLIKDYRTE